MITNTTITGNKGNNAVYVKGSQVSIVDSTITGWNIGILIEEKWK